MLKYETTLELFQVTQLTLTLLLVCFKKVTAKWSNTSNLTSHLRMHHTVQFSELQALSGLTKQSKSRESTSAAAAAAGTPTITGC